MTFLSFTAGAQAHQNELPALQTIINMPCLPHSILPVPTVHLQTTYKKSVAWWNGIETDIAFECKWNPKAKGTVSRVFSNAYPTAEINMIHPENTANFFV